MPQPILLIEDHPFDAELIRIALDRCSVPNEIVCFDNGQEAVDYIDQISESRSGEPSSPALVLLDLDLPLLRGEEVLKAIRTTLKIDSPPVIVLTHCDDESRIQRVRNLGVEGYLSKPSSIGKFLSEVQDMLVKHGLVTSGNAAQ